MLIVASQVSCFQLLTQVLIYECNHHKLMCIVSIYISISIQNSFLEIQYRTSFSFTVCLIIIPLIVYAEFFGIIILKNMLI